VLLWDAGALGPSVGLSAAGEAARHRRGDNYAFVGGHVSWRPRGRYPPADVDLQPLRADQ
jgi:prepilin-type processing-associated H-X9-DG protein